VKTETSQSKTASVYTVTFAKTAGAFEISRYFSTKKAAMKWAKWLSSASYILAVNVYRGPAGGELIAEMVRQ
jgi:hypothetical protein